MRVRYSGDRFECVCTFDERHQPKDAGFLWSHIVKKWYTKDPRVAARLRTFWDESAKRHYELISPEIKPYTGRLSYPVHLKPFEFQLEAARFALSRKRSYLALDPGLGKTVVAAIVRNTLKLPTIYICPPFLVENTRQEMVKWSGLGDAIPLFIAADSKPDVLLDLLKRVKATNGQALLVVDEAHRFKNEQAKRSKAVYALTPFVSNVLFLSGTPMPNRPIELYPVLRNSAPHTIDNMSKTEYGSRFCQLKETRFGWDFSGASNLDELNQRVVGPFMLRMRKGDVLRELPPKLEEMVILNTDMPPKLGALDSKLLRSHSPEDLMKQSIAASIQVEGEALHLATYRRELGLAKVKEAVKFIKGLLEDDESEALLVFGIHKAVIAALSESLKDYDPFVITGDTPMHLREACVKEFQSDVERRLFIGNIQACGTGFTLTKATRVVFVEYAWTPSDNSQAADRAHRIGQTEPVFVQYLVFKNSVDRAVLETIFNKQRVTAHI